MQQIIWRTLMNKVDIIKLAKDSIPWNKGKTKREFHNEYGRKKNDENQLSEFLERNK